MKYRNSSWLKVRIVIVALFYIGLFGIMAARGYQLQLSAKSDDLGKRAERQLVKRITLPPVRGKILDRNSEELATNRDVISIYAQPQKMQDPDAAAAVLASLLGEKDDIVARQLNVKQPFVWLKRGLSPEKSDAVNDLQIDGVGVVKESRRYYPNMELAGHLIGFAGVDTQGLEGVELKYDDLIKGTTGHFIAERDALGRNIFPSGLDIKGSSGGNDVVLTIDKTIQHITERELGDAVKRYNAKGGMALVMDPHSGEVLATSVQPYFNPNFYENYNPEDWRNRVITDSFEPGSTFKIFLAAGAIDSGKIVPQDIFFCENGRIKVHDKFIHDSKKHGWLSVENILKVSSNIGAYKIAEKAGKEDFYRYILDFGFGAKSGIDLPGESSGYVRPAKKWSPVGFANISFGQGISVTALQLVNAISAVANGGYLMKPYVVKKVVNKSKGTILSTTPEKIRRVISEETAMMVTAILKKVTSSDGGTGGRAAIEGYQVAGKTGTSQKYDVETGKYSTDRHISSFVGFLPADDPKLAILVMLDEPKDHYYGGRVAAPVFRKIAEQSLAYMNVAPLQEKRLFRPYRQVSAKPDRAVLKRAIFPLNGDLMMMPDLRGFTLREVLVRMGSTPSNIEGSGVVKEQRPLPGEPFDGDWSYRVKLGEESFNTVLL